MEVFARVASKAVEVFEVEKSYAHLDTSSIKLHRKYESDVAQRAVNVFDAVEIRHGYLLADSASFSFLRKRERLKKQ